MNKYQKIIIQMVKDDMKKKNHEILQLNFRQLRSAWTGTVKIHNDSLEYVRGFKNYNKTLEI